MRLVNKLSFGIGLGVAGGLYLIANFQLNFQGSSTAVEQQINDNSTTAFYKPIKGKQFFFLF